MIEMSFNEKCYEVLKGVPRGKVTTYGELARAVGVPGAARAVGNAMNKNPYAPEVPCHRVVGSNGKMVGFADGIDKKIKLLLAEGVEVKNRRVDLSKFMYKF